MANKTTSLEELFIKKIQTGQWKTGEAIPSRNSLIHKYGLSRCTVERAIKNLINAGLLKAKQGVSTIVTAPAPETGISRITVISHFRSPMLSPDITDLRCPVRFIFTEEAELFESELCEPGNCVIWFYPGYGALEQMNRLKAKNVRQFLVNRSFDGYSFVTIDYFASLKEGLKILLEKCGRETAVIGYDQNYENRPWQPERIIGYFQAASTLGMSTGEGRIFLKSYTDTVNEMNNLVQQLFLPGTRKLGITILNQELVLPFLMATSQVNRKPGRDFYLLLCDYREELEPYLGILMLNQRGYSILGEYMLKLVIEHILQGQLDFRQRIKLELVGSDRL